MENIRKEMGTRVRVARLSRSITQAALAARVGSTQSGIARLESGIIHLPTLGFLQRVADALSMDLELPAFKEKDAQ